MIQTMIKGIIDLVYPPKCALCKKSIYLNNSGIPIKALNQNPAEILCLWCRSLIEANFPPFCPKCSRHLIDPTLVRCKECIRHKHNFNFAWSACVYNDALKKLLHKFKYEQKTLLRNVFPEFIFSFLEKYNLDIQQFDMIVPIPLHSTKFRERGYNQAELLAEKISEKYKIPLSTNNLTRASNTKAHAFLSEKERWTNIKGAFKIKNSHEFYGKNVLLLDDLLTTGATTSEAASILKNSGANVVGVLTLAVTI